ncbi:unnamed protein product [Rotaria sordida]|uniref:Uncharacterized protein n=1 Tax=Rotaria sordida TaxID=392033 RepID=A0A814VT09_9BILA|nr:unnamed protein product [Rotaria sordida]CAF1460116.1 unnamed protein product [Rotaria sordida]
MEHSWVGLNDLPDEILMINSQKSVSNSRHSNSFAFSPQSDIIGKISRQLHAMRNLPCPRQLQKLNVGMSQLNDGMTKLNDSMVKLTDGMITLNDGMVKLNDGMTKLNDSMVKLTDGMITLNDGMVKLNNGMTKLNDGMLKLNDQNKLLIQITLPFIGN